VQRWPSAPAGSSVFAPVIAQVTTGSTLRSRGRAPRRAAARAPTRRRPASRRSPPRPRTWATSRPWAPAWPRRACRRTPRWPRRGTRCTTPPSRTTRPRPTSGPAAARGPAWCLRTLWSEGDCCVGSVLCRRAVTSRWFSSVAKEACLLACRRSSNRKSFGGYRQMERMPWVHARKFHAALLRLQYHPALADQRGAAGREQAAHDGRGRRTPAAQGAAGAAAAERQAQLACDRLCAGQRAGRQQRQGPAARRRHRARASAFRAAIPVVSRALSADADMSLMNLFGISHSRKLTEMRMFQAFRPTQLGPDWQV